MVNITNLTYCPRRTDLAAGQCSMVDYVVLLLGNAGSMRQGQIHSAVAFWRGLTLSRGQCTRITHLTDASCGYISPSYEDTSNTAYFGTRTFGLWYRISTGLYALNRAGRARYERLSATAQ
jgi:hypothetical protein